MYTIIETNTYKTDYKKLKKTGVNKGVLEDIKRVTEMLKMEFRYQKNIEIINYKGLRKMKRLEIVI